MDEVYRQTWDVYFPIVHGACMCSQRLWKRRNVIPFVCLKVIGFNARQITCLVPSPNNIQVLIQAASEETRSPETKTRWKDRLLKSLNVETVYSKYPRRNQEWKIHHKGLRNNYSHVMKSSYYFMNNKSFSEGIVPLLHGR